MDKLELQFRKDLIGIMAPYWVVTIHVENHLNPGVPDLSYLMHGGEFETGWLELKAVTEPSRIKVESSQHTWMQRHADKIPAHFLMLIGDVVILTPGDRHGTLSAVHALDDIREGSLFNVPFADLRRTLPIALRQATHRMRSNEKHNSVNHQINA